jgi:hypothetical protein
VNAVAATYAEADHAKVAVFHVTHRVVLLAILDNPPLRAHLVGVNAVPIIQETVHLGATSVVTVVRHRALGILLRPVFKRF